MPIDASIPLQAKSPDVMSTLGQVLQLQQGQAAVRTARAHAQQEEQTAKQRAALADFDWQSLNGDDGTIDLNKLAKSSDLKKAAGDQFPQVLSAMVGAKQQQVGAIAAVTGLSTEQRAQWGSMLGALRSDPDVAEDNPTGRAKVDAAMAQFQRMYPDASRVLQAYGPVTQHAPPGKLNQALANIQMQADTANSQISRQTPDYGYVSTGARDTLVQKNPLAPGGAVMPGTVTKEIPPGITTNAAGQLIHTGGVGSGGVTPATVVPGANPSTAAADVQRANAARLQGTVTEAAGVPQVKNVLQNIIKLSDSVQTGPKTEQVNRIKAMVGNFIPGAKNWKDSTSAYQEMTKFMEQLALRSWGAAGGSGSNAQLEAQVRANPNNEYNSQTVKELAKWVMAGEDAKQGHARAMATWLKEPGHDVNNLEQFELGWANAMDPRVYQVQGMSADEVKKKFSKEERTDIRKSYEQLKAMGGIE